MILPINFTSSHFDVNHHFLFNLRAFDKIHNAIVVSSFSPININVHRHEDDSTVEVPVTDTSQTGYRVGEDTGLGISNPSWSDH